MAEHDAKLLKNRIALSEEIRKKQGVFNKMEQNRLKTQVYLDWLVKSL